MKAIALTVIAFLAVSASFGNGLFNISYRNIPDSMQPAIQMACNTWAGLIDSDIQINVSVTGKKLSRTVGAYAQAGLMLHDFEGAPKKGTIYPVALAEKLAHKELNKPTDADIKISINLNAEWYLPTDGNCPENKNDLSTIVLHEMGHGLGLNSSILVKQKPHPSELRKGEWMGTAEFEDYPTVLDSYIKQYNGNYITEINEGFDLYHALLDSIVFESPLLLYLNGDAIPLYAPVPYDEGSSTVHPDYPTDSTFLMSYFFRSGTVIRKPSEPTLAMLYSMGWKSFYIEHDEIKDSEQLSDSVSIEFSLINELPYYQDSVFLHYSLDGMKNKKSIPLTSTNKEFRHKIASFEFEHEVSYYISLVDSANRLISFPNEGYYSYFRGIDTIVPEITHTPLLSLDLNKDSVVFAAKITDNAKIGSAIIEFISEIDSVIDTVQYELSIANDSCRYTLFLDGTFNEKSSLKYRFIVSDNAKKANTAYYPQNAYFTASFKKPQVSFSFDFNKEGKAPFSMQGFSIQQPKGFESKALHTSHLYRNSGKDGDTVQYIASLNVPIIIQPNNAYIIFDEIAMVEIHSPGKKFGDYGFWDYAIVEGSKDGGKSWHAFEFEGYDASKHQFWQDQYVANIVDSSGHKNSFTLADESYYRKSIVNMKANKYFRTGDIVNIRFRLMSDAFSYGWGWAIDNLEIQTMAVATEEHSLELKIYPRICSKILHIDCPAQINHWQITDLMGKKISASEMKQNTINTSHLSSGMYFISVYANGKQKTEPFFVE